MTFSCKHGLLLLLALPFCNRKPGNTGKDAKPSAFITKANDEHSPITERITAAQSAYLLALAQKNIPVQIESLRTRGRLYLTADSSQQAMDNYKTLARLADSMHDRENYGIACNNMGLIFSDWSFYDSAVTYHLKASREFELLKDTLRIIQSKINTGIAYKDLGEYQIAFSVTLDAARVLENSNPSNEAATAYTTLGNTLKEMRRPKEALDYHRKAMDIRSKLNDSAGIAGCYNNIGNVYKSYNRFDTALQFYFRSLELKKKFGTKRSIVTTVDNIAETYLGLEQFELAEQYQMQAMAMRNALDDKDGWMTTANRLAGLYLARNDLNKAEVLALQVKASVDEPIYRRQELENALLLKDIYTARKDHRQAAAYASRAIALKDSLFNADMSEAISKMNVRFETEQQQKKLELAQKNDIIQDQQITTQQYFIMLLGGVVLLLVITSYLLYTTSQLRKKSRQRAELLMTELNHRVKNNLQMISAILNLQTQTATNAREAQMLEAARSRIQSIGIVHNLLYQKQYDGYVDVNALISRIVHHLSKAFENNEKKVELSLSVEDISLEADQAIPLGLIINELLTNIYKYTKPAAGQVNVQLRLMADHEKCSLYLFDNGAEWSMDEARIHKKGLGLLLTDMLVQQLQATSWLRREQNENIYHISFRKT